MGSDHLVVYVDRLVRPPVVESADEPAVPNPAVPCDESAGPSRPSFGGDDVERRDEEDFDEEAPLIPLGECRICQEEDRINNLEAPCGCSGSLKYAHRKCVQHWCNEKGNITCEICHQVILLHHLIGGWTISGTPLDLHDPRLLAMAEAEHHFLETEYDEYAATNASGAAFCRSAALILMALLLLRHALTVTDGDSDDDDETTAFFSLFLLRAAGFLLPCYIMAWAISILQRRRQRQEAAALAATQVAFVLQSGQRRGLHFTIAPGPRPMVAPRQEPALA
ncbi:Zinc finger, RING-CH-type [Dillenia turbinata]|uniref:Zinc finger, RING-CH-type n=1 Tax=Dillenia turbinata TaxID=194707 RepID=A0AAN8VBR2_9MAGN